ncbi:hypothetical protein KC19_11G085600 [Ceratodon purpureus]|uniref:tRNA pseudouridine synthase n=1 Tax=Ceratodon purpureus TaxID=3225 RepID=A0A8T0GCD6_CERPU|nr:hypothetical protein KC19_11G085600 [Ceratodon purpureus]
MSEQEASAAVKGSEGVKRKREEMIAVGKAGVQRYLVTVEYMGTRFLGFQRQRDKRTVQGCLEAALEKFVGEPVISAVSSRTDAGVHALANTCHVDIERRSKRKPGEVMPPHDPGVVHRAINHFLHAQKNAGDMAVVGVRCVPPGFHCRYKAQERTYHYRLLTGNRQMSIFQKDQAWHVSEELNLESMMEACKVLVGHHNFSSFRATGCQALSPIKTLDELHVCEMPVWPCFPSPEDRKLSSESPETKDIDKSTSESTDPILRSKQGTQDNLRCIVVTARARSFLYHQVRLLVGTLKAVGSGALAVHDVKRILDAQDITQVPAMAPACGLYLAHVKYDFSDDNELGPNTDDESE